MLVPFLTAGAVAGVALAVWAQQSSQPVGAADDPSQARPSSTAAPRSTTTTEPPLRTATIAFGGDVLIHSGVWEAAATPTGHDFTPMLAPVAPILGAADLALCHLEVTLARPGERLTGYPRFRAPAELAGDLAGAGFDGCSVSSNHALDYGASGVSATLDALDAAGLGHAGTARDLQEDTRAATYVAGGIRVAHLSYAYGFNGFREPAGQEWLADEIDPATILTDARAARAAGAELVVVSLHWGSEYVHDVTTAQRGVAEALAAAPGVVDLVAGHHAHVVQPISKVGDLWVIWGMGNLLSNNSPRCCRADTTDGVVVTATIRERADRAGVMVERVTFTPTWNERATYRVLPAAETLRTGVADPALAADLRASYERTAAHVLALATGLPITASSDLPAG